MISACFIAMGVTIATTPIVIRIARRADIDAAPRADRWHTAATPSMGGIAIFCGFITAALLTLPPDRSTIAMLGGASALFIAGSVDDLHPLHPLLKLFCQLTAAAIALSGGLLFHLSMGLPVDYLITIVWIVTITNSFNLIDNMDGLAAGIAIISCTALVACSGVTTTSFPVSGAICIGAAALGFLPYNFNRAKIFMGDSGSLPLGYIVAVSAIGAQPVGSISLFGLLIPIALVALPLVDTLFVIQSRTRHGRKIWHGGKDHLSHRLAMHGRNDRTVVLLLYLAHTVLIMLLWSASLLPVVWNVLPLLLAALLLGVGLNYLSNVDPYRRDISGSGMEGMER